MGEAIVAGLSGGSNSTQIAVVEPVEERRTALAQQYGSVAAFGSIEELVGPSAAVDVAVIAVKPSEVALVCAELQSIRPGLVVSIAAGITLGRLEGWLPGLRVIRAMPNTAALVGKGITAVSAGSSATSDNMAFCATLLGGLGPVLEVKESSMDAVTGLSGSGPAYVFLIAESLIEAGVLNGLSREVATELTLRTIAGSAELALQTGTDVGVLRAAVTSPGGTTAEGLRVLEARGVRSAFIEAVTAAARRSGELGS